MKNPRGERFSINRIINANMEVKNRPSCHCRWNHPLIGTQTIYTNQPTNIFQQSRTQELTNTLLIRIMIVGETIACLNHQN